MPMTNRRCGHGLGHNRSTMRLATGLSLFVASALATLALADIPAESTVYVIYREEGTGGCISTGSPGILNDVVGIRGFVLDEEYSLVGGRSEETGTCAEEMACFVAPLSEACLNLERTFEAFGEIIAQDVPPTTSASLVVPGAQEDDTTTTNYYNCVRKTPSLSQCYQVTCGSSSMYPHCSFDIISTSDLANNSNALVESHAASNNNIVYAAHYSDDACSIENLPVCEAFWPTDKRERRCRCWATVVPTAPSPWPVCSNRTALLARF